MSIILVIFIYYIIFIFEVKLLLVFFMNYVDFIYLFICVIGCCISISIKRYVLCQLKVCKRKFDVII
jgi:hypothetical protein